MGLVVALTRQTPSFIVRQRLTVLAKFRIQKNSSSVQEALAAELREERLCHPVCQGGEQLLPSILAASTDFRSRWEV